MYLECSNKEPIAAFLEEVLDPLPWSNGGYSKADFLMGRMFLKKVQFPSRPAFDKLLRQLAKLFAARYSDTPSEEQARDIAKLKSSTATNAAFT